MAKTVTKTKIIKKESSGGKAPLYNLKSEKVGDVSLPKSIFGVKVNNDLIAQVIRTYLSNRRSAHAKVKERGDVAGSTRKMYAQKGTGQARHSTSKVGIFVGGGSVHGPQGNQNFKLTINRKTKEQALNSILTKFALDNKILAIEDLATISPKTKIAWDFMEKLESINLDLAKTKKIGIITEPKSENVLKAFRNIPGFTLLSTNSLNVLDLSRQNILIFSKIALESLK